MYLTVLEIRETVNTRQLKPLRHQPALGVNLPLTWGQDLIFVKVLMIQNLLWKCYWIHLLSEITWLIYKKKKKGTFHFILFCFHWCLTWRNEPQVRSTNTWTSCYNTRKLQFFTREMDEEGRSTELACRIPQLLLLENTRYWCRSCPGARSRETASYRSVLPQCAHGRQPCLCQDWKSSSRTFA